MPELSHVFETLYKDQTSETKSSSPSFEAVESALDEQSIEKDIEDLRVALDKLYGEEMTTLISGASKDQIDNLKQKFSVDFPEELEKLLSQVNGVGSFVIRLSSPYEYLQQASTGMIESGIIGQAADQLPSDYSSYIERIKSMRKRVMEKGVTPALNQRVFLLNIDQISEIYDDLVGSETFSEDWIPIGTREESVIFFVNAKDGQVYWYDPEELDQEDSDNPFLMAPRLSIWVGWCRFSAELAIEELS